MGERSFKVDTNGTRTDNFGSKCKIPAGFSGRQNEEAGYT